MQKVVKLANFNAKEPSINSIDRKVITQELNKIQKVFNFDKALESLMNSTISYFDTLINLPDRNHNIIKTKTTFETMLNLYQKREVIASEKDQSARDNKALLMSNAGVEKGFITGKTSGEAKKSIEYRTFLLLITFQKAKAMGKEDEFYVNLGSGDPCANARLGRVEEFLSSLSELGDVLQDLSNDRIFVVSDVALMSMIDEMVADDKIQAEEIEQLTPQDIDETEFAKQLAQLASTNTKKISWILRNTQAERPI